MIVSGEFDWIDGPIVLVSIARTPATSASDETPQRFQYQALIDTGATRTAIAQVAQDELKLEEMGLTPITGPNRGVLCQTCVMDLFIPTDDETMYPIPGINVPIIRMPQHQDASGAKIPKFQVLLGRDVLCSGTLTMTPNSFTLELPDPYKRPS